VAAATATATATAAGTAVVAASATVASIVVSEADDVVGVSGEEVEVGALEVAVATTVVTSIGDDELGNECERLYSCIPRGP